MLYKSMSRKDGGGSTGQLLSYILKEKEREKVEEKCIYRFNVFGKSVKDMHEEYLKNEVNRIHKSKNRVSAFHEIISFSKHEDRHRITDEVLRETAEKFFELRNPNSLTVMAVHHEKDAVHLHACISGTTLDGQSMRISREAFKQLKLDLEQWRLERFPELQHSYIDHNVKSKSIIGDKEFQVIKREGVSENGKIQATLERLFERATSKEDFYTKIKEQFSMYTRGKNDGITLESGRNLRLSSLGFTSDRMTELDKVQENKQSLEAIRERHFPEITIEYDLPEVAENEPEVELEDRDIVIEFYRWSEFKW